MLDVRDWNVRHAEEGWIVPQLGAARGDSKGHVCVRAIQADPPSSQACCDSLPSRNACCPALPNAFHERSSPSVLTLEYMPGPAAQAVVSIMQLLPAIARAAGMMHAAQADVTLLLQFSPCQPALTDAPSFVPFCVAQV